MSKKYTMTIMVTMIVTIVGVVAMLAGIGFTMYLIHEGDLGWLGVPSAVLVSLFGLLLILAGEVTKAIVDNANNSREIIEELKKK